MKRFAVIAATLLLSLGVLASAQASSRAAKSTVIAATLTGAQEVPGPGAPNGVGTVVLKLKPDAGQICFVLEVSGISLPATAAHIHRAPVGVAGPVVVPLTPAPDANGGSHGCVAADPALIWAIIGHPDQYYVNVHNADFPAGAVRGQLG